MRARMVRIDVHGTGARYPAEIVARQVNEHDVFGRFLRVGKQGLFVGLVLFPRDAARQRARDRSQRGLAMVQLHERFG